MGGEKAADSAVLLAGSDEEGNICSQRHEEESNQDFSDKVFQMEKSLKGLELVTC